MAEPENGNRESGRIEATLDSIDARLGRIEHVLESLTDWQRRTDSRLATGQEKFRHLEGRDYVGAITASVIGTAAAVISYLIMAFRK